MHRSPVDVLEFSDDLRPRDVEQLQEFLLARLADLVQSAEPDSAARFTAERLREVTHSDCTHLDDQLVHWEDMVTAGLQNQSGLVQTLRQDIGLAWNRLVATADHFRDHPDWRPRWRRLRYMCVEHAEFVEQAQGDATTGGYADGAHP